MYEYSISYHQEVNRNKYFMGNQDRKTFFYCQGMFLSPSNSKFVELSVQPKNVSVEQDLSCIGPKDTSCY